MMEFLIHYLSLRVTNRILKWKILKIPTKYVMRYLNPVSDSLTTECFIVLKT